MLNVIKIHEKTFRGNPFKFAEVSGTPADHASWWTFDDEQELRMRFWNPKPDDVVLDIGTAFGSYALPALACGARVICFSPADFDTELLEKNLSLNPFEDRCVVVRDGLYSLDGFFDPDHNEFKPTTEGANGGQWLRVRSLDSFIDERPGIDRVDWMKIDVEGAELEVLKGGKKTITTWKPNILVENHEFHVRGIGESVKQFLSGLDVGYTCHGPIPYHSVSHSFFSVEK